MKYNTLVYAVGREFKCKQTYDEILQLLKDGLWRTIEGGTQWMPPLELLTKGEPGLPPTRTLIQPHAIAAVVEI